MILGIIKTGQECCELLFVISVAYRRQNLAEQ